MSATQCGREPVQIVELVQDLCANTYGVAPCTAAGLNKCFNTRRTCQDPANYNGSDSLTLRFIRPQSQLIAGEYLIPSLVSVRVTPTQINAGGGDTNKGALGARGVATITLTDHPHTDNLVDPYLSERGYDPLTRSTFWAKWLARNPFYQNRIIRILDGYVGQPISSFTSRTYLIDKISGPNSSGRVTITGKDVLTLADGRKAQAPAVSLGELIVDTLATDTTLRITGAVASEYPAPGLVRINDELISYTGVSTISATEIRLTGCTRGTNGTVAEEHEAEDRAQRCLQYSNVNAVDIARDLLLNYANVPPEFIDSADWNAERDKWMTPFNVSTIITEPTSVNQLLAELTEQCVFYVWWDERVQKIRLRAIRPVTETPRIIDDSSHILAESVTLSEDTKARISQIWTFFSQRNPTEKLDEERNYSFVRIRADLEKESADQYGEPSIRKIYSRWLQTPAQVINLNARMMSRYSTTPRMMSLRLDAKDSDIWTGDVIDVIHRGIVDEFGNPTLNRFQVISADELDAGSVIEYKLLKFEFLGNFAYWMASSAPDYTAATDEQKKQGMWWSDVDGLLSDGTAGYTWQ